MKSRTRFQISLRGWLLVALLLGTVLSLTKPWRPWYLRQLKPFAGRELAAEDQVNVGRYLRALRVTVRGRKTLKIISLRKHEAIVFQCDSKRQTVFITVVNRADTGATRSEFSVVPVYDVEPVNDVPFPAVRVERRIAGDNYSMDRDYGMLGNEAHLVRYWLLGQLASAPEDPGDFDSWVSRLESTNSILVLNAIARPFAPNNKKQNARIMTRLRELSFSGKPCEKEAASTLLSAWSRLTEEYDPNKYHH